MIPESVMKALEQARPHGISFSPMAMRLILKEVPLSEHQIEALKAKMCQFGNGLWFSRSMVFDDETYLAFRRQAETWLSKHGCFSVERLYEAHLGNVRHMESLGDCAAFLQHLGFHVESHRPWGFLCFMAQSSLNEHLASISAILTKQIDKSDGVLVVDDLDETMPHLTYKALNAVRAQFLPDIHESEVAGLPCWCSSDAILLPDDFSAKVTTAVDALVAIGEKVSLKNLEFALDLFYGYRVRQEHALPADAAFLQLCARHYQGESDVFAHYERGMKKKLARHEHGKQKKKEKPSRRRLRSPNSRFDSLDIPVGSTLSFTRKPAIACTVLDGANQVKYDGKAWSISKLACHLLGVPAANGFWHFSFEGETLLKRRSRFEKQGRKTREQMELFSEPVSVRKSTHGIIGLTGRVIAPATWRAFQKAASNPEVAEWARRVEKGERIEAIASEKGLKASTVNEYIVNRRRHSAVCAKNGIETEVGNHV